MPTNSTQYRYHLPERNKGEKAIKGDCPQCSPKYRRTLSRYIDAQTGEPLPEEFGRCDRESKCTYHLSPYHKGQSGMSYADMVFEQWKVDNPLPPRAVPRQLQTNNRDAGNSPQRGIYLTPGKSQVVSTPFSPTPIYCLPAEVFERTLGHYDRNQFVILLRQLFGPAIAEELIKRFKIGTCGRPNDQWPEAIATVFWLLDLQGRVRAGQINLFDQDWHRHEFTYIDKHGESQTSPCINTASNGLLHHYKRNRKTIPGWLTDYDNNADKWPIPFGLHQLNSTPADKPVAIVEACKTAVVCAGYFPQYVWLAIGSKSYLNAKRLAGLKGRTIVLYPDLKAYNDWSKRAEAMRVEGYRVSVSSLLQDNVTDEQRQTGKDLDLADFLVESARVSMNESLTSFDELPTANEPPRIITTLAEWKPGIMCRPDPALIEYL